MSEHQFIHFLAIDQPLNDDQLAYMRRQSSRAEITPWEFANEYHYGDFHGNAPEMLRRGYDVHLHYANFGVRRLMFRLPSGLPCDSNRFKAFRPEFGVDWMADPSPRAALPKGEGKTKRPVPARLQKGEGRTAGILRICPEADAGSYDEYFDDLDSLLREIAPVRELLMAGDLRPLYLAWLACTGDDEAMEPPVPAGLGDLAPSLLAMAEFYQIGQDLLAAAAERSPAAPQSVDPDEAIKNWIDRQPQNGLRELVRRLLTSSAAAARAETLARIRGESPATAWPVAEPARTLGELRASALGVEKVRIERAKKAAEAARRKRLAGIASHPEKLIAKVLELVKIRSVKNYNQAAEELADLREALGSETGPARVRAVAEKLRRANPSLTRLVSALRKKGLLEK
jgi:hypothetical protein